MHQRNLKCCRNSIVKNKWVKPVLGALLMSGIFYSGFTLAADELVGAMTDIKSNFGTGSSFIKILYAIEIIAGGYAWITTKHPKAIIGIVVLAIFMTYGLTHWVFV